MLQGLSVFAACVGVLLVARIHHGPDAARALTFATLVISFLVVILINRSWNKNAFRMLRAPNAAMRWVLAGTALFLGLVLYNPLAQRIFHFAPLHPKDLAFSIAVGAGCVLWFEAYKKFKHRIERT